MIKLRVHNPSRAAFDFGLNIGDYGFNLADMETTEIEINGERFVHDSKECTCKSDVFLDAPDVNLPVSIDDFQVGDMVEVVEYISGGPIIGFRGVVLAKDSVRLSVRFDKSFTNGHGCDVNIENGRGWFYADWHENLHTIVKVN